MQTEVRTHTTHTMKIMDPLAGHKYVPWDPADPKSVAKAKKAFDKAIKQGKRAFRTEHRLVPGEMVTEFDPSHRELLLVPQLAGG